MGGWLEGAGHEVVVHDVAVADVGADGGVDLVAGALVGADGALVVDVDA